EYVAVERIGSRGAELGVQRPAVVNRVTGIGITASLGKVSAACAAGAGCGDVELRTVDVVVQRVLAVERAHVVDAESQTIRKLLLNAEVELDGVRPAIAGVEGDDLVERQERGAVGGTIEAETGIWIRSGWKLRRVSRVWVRE